MKTAYMNRRQINARVFVYVVECIAGVALTAIVLASRGGAA
jgi:hypothetical protein